MRNPLSAINQAAQLLEEDGAVAPEGQRLLSMICNNAKRIDCIVGEVRSSIVATASSRR